MTTQASTLSLPSDVAKRSVFIREYLRSARDRARQALSSGTPARCIARDFSTAVEQVAAALFACGYSEVNALPGEPQTPLRAGLVATGGLGRQEMAPFSDVDLVIVSPEPEHPRMEALLERVLYPLWDARVEVGHAVRSPAQFASIARSDLEVTTTAAMWRSLAGDSEVIQALGQSLAKAVQDVRANRVLIAEAIGHWTHPVTPTSVYCLEPDIKMGPGGLRDIQRVGWVTLLIWGSRKWAEIRENCRADAHDVTTLEQSWHTLFGIRVAAHLVAGRRQEALVFEIQDAVASALGIECNAANRTAADELLTRYYRTARGVRAATTRILERCADALEHRNRPKQTKPEYVDGFPLVGGRLHLESATLECNPLDWLRIFRVSQVHNVPLDSATRARINQFVQCLDDDVLGSPEASRVLTDILGDPRLNGEALDNLHELGVLERIIPEFQAINGLIQRDLYHRYTVDAHLVYCARCVMGILSGVTSGLPQAEIPDEVADAARRIARRSVVVLAALLHDIGKGLGHGHSERGAGMAIEIAKRLRMNREDTEDVAFLVREHLTMYIISQRRDLEDAELVARFAANVETAERLDMLLLVSYADAVTTGPEVWNEWRASLLRMLFWRARRALREGAAVDSLLTRASKRLDRVASRLADRAGAFRDFAARLPPRHLVTYRTSMLARHLDAVQKAEAVGGAAASIERDEWRGGWEVVVAALDRPGLLADLAAALAAAGVSVRAAHISGTTDGVVIDTFVVASGADAPFGQGARRAKLEDELVQAARGVLDCTGRLEKRRKTAAILGNRAPASEVRIVYDLDAANDATVMDLYAPDRIGLLSDVATAIFSAGASIALAHITTEGERAVDAFYLVDAGSARPLSQAQRADVETALHGVFTP